MNISEKVIRYADGEMSTAERNDFEKELEISPALRDELQAYKNLTARTEEIKNVRADENYFASVIPEFRLRQSVKQSKKLYPRLAFAASFAVILFLFVMNLYNDTEKIQPEITSEDFTAGQIDSILDYYTLDYSEIDTSITGTETVISAVEEVLLNELNITDENQEELFSYTSAAGYNQNLNNLSSEEAEIVYNEILNKRFF